MPIARKRGLLPLATGSDTLHATVCWCHGADNSESTLLRYVSLLPDGNELVIGTSTETNSSDFPTDWSRHSRALKHCTYTPPSFVGKTANQLASWRVASWMNMPAQRGSTIRGEILHRCCILHGARPIPRRTSCVARTPSDWRSNPKRFTCERSELGRCTLVQLVHPSELEPRTECTGQIIST